MVESVLAGRKISLKGVVTIPFGRRGLMNPIANSYALYNIRKLILKTTKTVIFHELIFLIFLSIDDNRLNFKIYLWNMEGTGYLNSMTFDISYTIKRK